MKKVFLLLVVCLSVFLVGCDTEKTFVFNKPYDEVYTKTIQFIVQKGWNIQYQDKEAKTIIGVLYSYVSSSNNGNINQYGQVNTYGTSTGRGDTLRFIFTAKSSNETSVIVSAKAQVNTIVWNTEATIKEYSDYILGITPPPSKNKMIPQ